jgi:hypothetical protein
MRKKCWVGVFNTFCVGGSWLGYRVLSLVIRYLTKLSVVLKVDKGRLGIVLVAHNL